MDTITFTIIIIAIIELSYIIILSLALRNRDKLYIALVNRQANHLIKIKNLEARLAKKIEIETLLDKLNSVKKEAIEYLNKINKGAKVKIKKSIKNIDGIKDLGQDLKSAGKNTGKVLGSITIDIVTKLKKAIDSIPFKVTVERKKTKEQE